MSDQISVIIPAYNASATLERCLSSVLSQTYANTEIIIVDDGSTDDTPYICDRFSSSNNKVTSLHLPHQGPSVARNAGLDAANGSYVAFVDSDDQIHPDYLKALYDLIIGHQTDVSAVSYQIVKDSALPQCVDDKTDVFHFDAQSAVADLLYQKHLDSSQCCKLYKRELLKGIYFPVDCRVYEDLLFVYNVYCKCSSIVWTNRKMYYYHKKSCGQMDSISPMVTDAFVVMERIRKDLLLRYPNLSKAIDNRTISVSFNLLKLLARSGRNNNNIEQICWSNIKTLRTSNIFDPNVRLKNKVGIIASLFGRHFLKMLFRLSKCA